MVKTSCPLATAVWVRPATAERHRLDRGRGGGIDPHDRHVADLVGSHHRPHHLDRRRELHFDQSFRYR